MLSKSKIGKLINTALIKRFKMGSIEGDDAYCLCCKSSLSTFFPTGHKRRPYAVCPVCDSAERQRMLYKYFSEDSDLFNPETEKSILHIAPEKQFHKVFSRLPKIKYTYGDLYPRKYQKGAVKINITNIPFPDNQFDNVICSHVLEHVPDDKKALKELYRVLKPDGFAIILVPVNKLHSSTYEDNSIKTAEEKIQHFGHPDHFRIYGQDFKTILTQVGFIVEVINYFKQCSEEYVFKYGFSDEDIFICKKQY